MLVSLFNCHDSKNPDYKEVSCIFKGSLATSDQWQMLYCMSRSSIIALAIHLHTHTWIHFNLNVPPVFLVEYDQENARLWRDVHEMYRCGWVKMVQVSLKMSEDSFG